MCQATILKHCPSHDGVAPRLLRPELCKVKDSSTTTKQKLSSPSPPLRRSSDSYGATTWNMMNSISDRSWMLEEEEEDILENAISSDKSKAQTLSTKTKTKSVSFGTVQVHEHAMILGDNPCACGPPMTIDWEHHTTRTCSVADFEENRPFPARLPEDLRLPIAQRIEVLKDDYTLREIIYAQAEAQRVADSRAQTARAAEGGLIKQWLRRRHWWQHQKERRFLIHR